MANVKDLTGKRFGRLIAVEEVGRSKEGCALWRCLCDCGKETYLATQTLTAGLTKSCGCYRREKMAKRATKHGKCGERIYIIWKLMKARCNNKTSKTYVGYGSRGIKVCDEWSGDNGFSNFYNWSTNNGYSDNLTIDRIDVNGNYEPSNCRWVTMIEQANNKRNNRIIECNGEKHTLAEWSRITGVNCETISGRIKRGWAIEDALFREANKSYKYLYKKSLEIREEK